MISVMIADDEYLIRQLVKKSVNWSELDMSIMWESENGLSALQIIRENRPDIALVDINMPFANGIELARAVFEEELPTKIVFITGYQEFEYAKKAIEYKVFDYILKPIRQEELLTVLKRLSALILQERRDKRGAEVLLNVKDMELLRSMAQGKPVQQQEKRPPAWETIFGEEYYVLVIRPDGIQKIVNRQALLNRLFKEAWLFLRWNRGIETIGYAEWDEYDVLVMPGRQQEDKERSIREEAELLRSHLAEKEEHTVTIGISVSHRGETELVAGLSEAISAAARRFNENGNKVYIWNSGMADWETKMRIRAREVLKLLETFSRKSLLKQEDDLEGFLKLIEEKDLSEECVKVLAMRLIAIMITFEEGAEQGILFSQFYASVMRCEQLCEVEELCHQWMQYEREQYQNFKTKKYSELVENSRVYINTNYADYGLSLNQIATNLNVNPAYLSNLFKQEMGMTITKYITACRMGKAAEILNNVPECTLSELSNQVGYNDPYYFSRSFKKYYGVSPLHYRLENDA